MNINSFPAASRKFYNVKRNCRDMYCAVTEKTICCRKLHNLSDLYPYIVMSMKLNAKKIRQNFCRTEPAKTNRSPNRNEISVAFKFKL